MRKPFTPDPAYDDGMPTLTDRRERQAQESRDQEPFNVGMDVEPTYHAPGGIPVYDKYPPRALDSGRRYGPLGLYCSPAEEESIRAAPDPHNPEAHDAVVRAAAFENALAAEAMGIPEEDVLAALGQADMVNLPEHYARFKIEPIRFISENGLDWFQGNIVKYVLRHDAKNGMEDLQKAKRYLEMLIAFKEGDPDWWRRRVSA